jgi:hypothetical protein
MVDLVVEGLVDNKIQDDRRFKGKQNCFINPRYIDYCGVKCYVVTVKEFIKMFNLGCRGTPLLQLHQMSRMMESRAS